MYLSIIIPLYNEENLIEDLLGKLCNVQYPSYVEKVEVIVVDDRSTDSSAEKVKQHTSNENISISLIQHEHNKGKGAAVKSGVAQCKGNVILVQDADMELSPDDIPSMLEAMYKLNVPFVNGSRYLPGILRTQASYRRYFANRIFTLLTSIFINVHLTDMACGYKLVKKELYDKLNLKEDRFGFEAELIIKCARLRKNWIAEVPVHYYPRNYGEGKKLRNADGLKILAVIFKYGLLRLK